MIRSKVEAVAIRRALISQTLDAAGKAIGRLPREYKRIYKLKYRSGLTTVQMVGRLNICDATVHKRVVYIRDQVALCLRKIPASGMSALVSECDQRSAP
ncbi:MAG: hypothetical protein ABSC17_10580 [Thermacetogeniaceae bacterium]